MDKIFTISRNNDVPQLRIKNFRNKSDGTTDVDIMYDDAFLDFVKAELKVQEVSKAALSDYVNKLVEKSVNGIDGYKMLIEDSNSV